MKHLKLKSKPTEAGAGGTGSKPAPVVGAIKVHHQHMVLIYVVLMVAIVVVGGYAVYHFRVQKKPLNSCSNQAQTGVLKDAAGALKPFDIKKLEPVANQIKATPQYQQYPSCLVVLATFYLNRADPQNTQSTYDQLVKVYKDKEGYNPLIAPYVATPTKFKPMLDFLNQQVKNVQLNSGNSYPIPVAQ